MGNFITNILRQVLQFGMMHEAKHLAAAHEGPTAASTDTACTEAASPMI